VLEESSDREEIIERVAALDIGKAELVCCVRVPGAEGKSRRVQEVTTYPTMTRALLGMIDRLTELGVTRVVMEATSDYWKPPFYLLEAAGFETWLVNAKDVKHLPGRPKTDKLDAVWLCKLAERQMLRPSFVPPPPIRVLRDLARYRADLIGARTAEKQRVEKLLEDAQIKLSVVASDIFGVSGRQMLAALIAGQRDPQILAQYAPVDGCAASWPIWKRPSPAGSTTTMPSCYPRCSPGSTTSTPTSPTSTPGSRPNSPLSLKPRHGWMRSPASGMTPPASSSPRSESTCPGSRPRRTCAHGPGSPPESRNPPDDQKATEPPATATATSPGSSVKRPSAPEGPTPSSANATDASLDDEARRKPSSRSVDPSS